MDTVPVTPHDIVAAEQRIRRYVRRTPVIAVQRADLGTPIDLTLKLELLQHAGSFKPRGAFNRVLSAGELPDAGLIAASGGNHGAAVAFVAKALGLRAEVFVPSTSPDIKRRLIEHLGATVTIVEGVYDDAQRQANIRQACSAALMVHPFDHPATVAGQGTMSMELDEQLGAGGFDTLIVASGGGGFIAGQAAWLGDRVKVVSVEPESSQCLRQATLAGRPVDVDVSGVAADSLGAKRIGDTPWNVVRRYVHDAVTVDDDQIRQAQRTLWDAMRLIVEPGGAAALAAIRSGAYQPAPGERVVVVVCGANCEPATVIGSATG
jgi:threonine dehydratase